VTSIILRVKESLKRDAGRGIARLDADVMRKLEVGSGDLIEVKGKRTTVAKVMPGYPQDKDLDIIRVDGTIRANAKAGIDDRATVNKTEGVSATRVEWPGPPSRRDVCEQRIASCW